MKLVWSSLIVHEKRGLTKTKSGLGVGGISVDGARPSLLAGECGWPGQPDARGPRRHQQICRTPLVVVVAPLRPVILL